MKTILTILALGTLLHSHTAHASPVSCSAENCAATCQDRVQSLGRPLPTRTMFGPAHCDLFNNSQTDGLACFCELSSGGAHVLVPRFVEAGTDAGTDPCWLHGRNHQCLMRTSELPSCNGTNGTAVCTAACQDLQTRIQTDEAASYTVATKGSLCRGQTCACVVQHDTGCYVNDLQRSHDCTLTTQQIAESLGGCACQVPGMRSARGFAPGWLALGALVVLLRRRSAIAA